MPAVHIHNLAPAVVAALKRRAAAHHRSLEAELRAILEAAAADRRPLRLHTVAIGDSATFSRDDIYGPDER
jgi:plasmid stability protein